MENTHNSQPSIETTEISNIQNQTRQNSSLKKFRLIKFTGWFAVILGILKIVNDSYILGLGFLYIYKDIPNPPRPGFAITIIVFAIAIVYILLGKRITHSTDKNVKIYLWILLVSSTVIGVYELLRPNYPLGVLLVILVLCLIPSLIIYIQLQKRGEIESKGLNLPYTFGIKSLVTFILIIGILIVFLPSVEKIVYPEIIWKTYQNTELGFKISYPSYFHFVSDTENKKGSAKFIIPEKPYPDPGYLSKTLEIADVAGTSTLRGYLAVELLAVQPLNLDEVEAFVRSDVSLSNTASNRDQGVSATFKHISAGGRDLPAISLTLTKNGVIEKQVTYIYFFIPPTIVFGKHQPSKLFLVIYNPSDSEIFQKIVSSMALIPVVQTDEDLFYTAEQNQDSSWCDQILNDVIKVSCNINVRGYPIVDEYPVNLDMNLIAGQQGTVRMIGTSTFVLSASKDTNATSGVAWIAFIVNPYDPWKLLKFDAVFDNGEQSEALLNIYWDAQNIGSEDGRFFKFSGKEAGPFELVMVDNQGMSMDSDKAPKVSFVTGTGAAHILGFRLDTFGTGTGSVTISNIRAEDMR